MRYPTSQFLIKCGLFLTPFVLLIAACSAVMIYIGEAMPLAWVVEHQRQAPAVLYRPQFGNRDLDFKTLGVDTRQPQVIAVGSSRVLQLRDGFFTASFYNAGAPAWQLPQVEALLTGLSVAPEIVLLGIDAPWFNAAYVGDEFPPSVSDWTNVFQVNRSVARAMLEGRQTDLGRWLNRQELAAERFALGIKAIENAHGFRNDGSEQYGDFLVAGYLHQPTERDRHLQWMRQGEEMYVYGDTPSADALNQLDALLTYAGEHGITVIGFMPPFTPTLYNDMIQRGNHRYIPQLAEALQTLFARHQRPFFDFSDGGQFGTDDDFFDGWHGSERVYLRLQLQMTRALPDLLGAYTDIDALQQLDANAIDTWHVLGN